MFEDEDNIACGIMGTLVQYRASDQTVPSSVHLVHAAIDNNEKAYHLFIDWRVKATNQGV
jgi:hypothetical protein